MNLDITAITMNQIPLIGSMRKTMLSVVHEMIIFMIENIIVRVLLNHIRPGNLPVASMVWEVNTKVIYLTSLAQDGGREREEILGKDQKGISDLMKGFTKKCVKLFIEIRL